jgi:hypothetical protein
LLVCFLLVLPIPNSSLFAFSSSFPHVFRLDGPESVIRRFIIRQLLVMPLYDAPLYIEDPCRSMCTSTAHSYHT